MNGALFAAGESPGLQAFSDAHALGCALLREDRLAASLSAGEVHALTGAALIHGADLADKVARRWSRDPDAIAAANRIAVEDVETDASYGTTIVFAQYRSRPLGIVLHRPAIERLDTQLSASGVQALWGGNTRGVFLAHELFHHFDEALVAPLCRRHRVPVLRLGPLRITAPLAGLREIAAGAFAQYLLRLPFHPRVLDVIAASGFRREQAGV
jgi:hypothetical protein